MNSKHLYHRLALSNIGKNRQIYLPHILAGTGLVAILYIMLTLMGHENLTKGSGGSYLPGIMEMGVWVVLLLSAIVVLYTNSFLMKQRKREFGLYNVLGMNKRDIGRILFWENVTSSLCSIVSGILAGIVLYKLCSLFICQILKVKTVMGFYVSLSSIGKTAVFFLLLYFVTCLYDRWQIWKLKPVELMQSMHAGEREPKVKWVLLVLGLAAIGSGYAIVLNAEHPLAALDRFFVAVLLVIAGTYFLFVAGTIAMLKFLKGRKGYYYKPNHMIAVSGLLYRMKQNAVGLASICILATGVLVMLSTTVSMYAGIDDSVRDKCKFDCMLTGEFGADLDVRVPEKLQQELVEAAQKAAAREGVEITYIDHQCYLEGAYVYVDGNLMVDEAAYSMNNEIVDVTFMTADEYERLTGIKLTLGENDLAYMPMNGIAEHEFGNFRIGSMDFNAVERLKESPISQSNLTVFARYFMVVGSRGVLEALCREQPAYFGREAGIQYPVMLDYKGSEAQGKAFEKRIRKELSSRVDAISKKDKSGGGSWSYDSKAALYRDLYGVLGGLFFLGIMLAFVFVFATAIVIYYKQISEGYEDRERFQIMLRVGMSRDEAGRSIKSQILLVFFLPLVVAVIHMAVAFPPLKLLLAIYFPPNNTLFVLCALASAGAFAVVYAAIYSVTAKIYHRIVM